MDTDDRMYLEGKFKELWDKMDAFSGGCSVRHVAIGERLSALETINKTEEKGNISIVQWLMMAGTVGMFIITLVILIKKGV